MFFYVLDRLAHGGHGGSPQSRSIETGIGMAFSVRFSIQGRMRMFHMKVRGYSLAAAALVVIVMMGCATLRPVAAPGLRPIEAKVQSPENGWWSAHFVIQWPEEKTPSWHIGLLLAHQIISPVLYQHQDHIVLWRFHRRAVRDDIGHQFSFIFYSSPETAREIYHAIESDARLAAMKRAGVIIRDSYDDTTQMSKPNVEDTSDLDWSSPIRKSWPYYMMGVSQMWLNLITEIAGEISKETEPSSVQDIEAFYQQVNAALQTFWREEGGHAFLHHLNALFEYESVIIYEKRRMTF
jgi:hypothetical protein